MACPGRRCAGSRFNAPRPGATARKSAARRERRSEQRRRRRRKQGATADRLETATIGSRIGKDLARKSKRCAAVPAEAVPNSVGFPIETVPDIEQSIEAERLT